MTMYRIHGKGVSKDLSGGVTADDAVRYLQRQLATVTAERDDWHKSYQCLQQVILDIGRNLGAKVPYEQVNPVARRRMLQLQTARDALQKIERQPITTAEGLAFTNAARTALEDIGKC